MYCSPVLLPFLCGRENLGHRKNVSLLGLFLGGRLATYAVLAAALALGGKLTMEFFDPQLARFLSQRAFLICGLFLSLSALLPRLRRNREKACGCKARLQRFLDLAAGDRGTALVSGLGVGLHICPPFWIAAFRSMNSAVAGNVPWAAAYFLLFYAGTLPFFLPLTGLPFFVGKLPYLRRIARISQALIGIYLLVFAGMIPILTGGGGL
jgi:sulfite exporter TauE/SafE